MKKEEANVYKTTNFHIASWLVMNDKELFSVNWPTKHRAEFVFQDFEGRDDLINDFFKQEQLQKKISADQELKARMYATYSPQQYDRDNE